MYADKGDLQFKLPLILKTQWQLWAFVIQPAELDPTAGRVTVLLTLSFCNTTGDANCFFSLNFH